MATRRRGRAPRNLHTARARLQPVQRVLQPPHPPLARRVVVRRELPHLGVGLARVAARVVPREVDGEPELGRARAAARAVGRAERCLLYTSPSPRD